MADRTVAVDNQKILEAIAQMRDLIGNKLGAIESTLEQLLREGNNSRAKPAPRTAKFPQNAKQWFVAQYMKDADIRAKHAAIASAVHDDKKYVAATTEEAKTTIEAQTVYDKLMHNVDTSKYDAIKAGYAAAREAYKKEHGHTAADDEPAPTTPAATSTTDPAAPEPPKKATTAPRKPRAPAKKKSAAAPIVANASLADVASADIDEDSGDDDQ
ncbi:MAG: hypothetical protein M0R66_00455 [Candidatus Omnitrophica bacterium]|nr:hypothetical protein [Candidatus Omnitrophota bacterium]